MLKNTKIQKQKNDTNISYASSQIKKIKTTCSKNQKNRKLEKKKRNKAKTMRDKFLTSTISEPNGNMTQPEIAYINNTNLTVEGVIEDIMSKSGPHLWEKQILKILNQYDDTNNRSRICAYRKAIVRLQDRLRNGDDPHMTKVIIKKIMRSYKKRLNVALDTLTNTPPSSDNEDEDKQTTKSFHLVPSIPQTGCEVLRKVDITHSVDTTQNNNKNDKTDEVTIEDDKEPYNISKEKKSIETNKINFHGIKKLPKEKITIFKTEIKTIKQPSKLTFLKTKNNMPLISCSKITKTKINIPFNKKNTRIFNKNIKKEMMTRIDILHHKSKNHNNQNFEKKSSCGINKTQKNTKSKYITKPFKMPFYIQAKCLNNKISKKTNVDKKLKENKNIRAKKPNNCIKTNNHNKTTTGLVILKKPTETVAQEHLKPKKKQFVRKRNMECYEEKRH